MAIAIGRKMLGKYLSLSGSIIQRRSQSRKKGKWMTVDQDYTVHHHVSIVSYSKVLLKICMLVLGKNFFFPKNVLHPDKTQNIPTKIKQGLCSGKKLVEVIESTKLMNKIVPPSSSLFFVDREIIIHQNMQCLPLKMVKGQEQWPKNIPRTILLVQYFSDSLPSLLSQEAPILN